MNARILVWTKTSEYSPQNCRDSQHEINLDTRCRQQVGGGAHSACFAGPKTHTEVQLTKAGLSRYALRGAAPKSRSHSSRSPQKSKIACLLPTEPGRQMMPFSALGVRHVLVAAARDEDVRRQRIVLASHFLDRCIHFAHGVAECDEGVLQAIRARICSSEHKSARFIWL
jgi:hypothetical protein